MGNWVRVMNYAKKVFLFRLAVCVVYACGYNLASFKERLVALEKKSAEENFILTESQLAALERKKDDDIACGEIETAHPGYLGSQDTFYVNTRKGVGRVYQQTFVDTYLKVAQCKLYNTKTPWQEKVENLNLN